MSHPVARVRKPAPAWTATAVVGQDFKDISLSNYKGKYVIMLFYPLGKFFGEVNGTRFHIRLSHRDYRLF